MTYKNYVETYETLDKAKRICDLACSCSTCRYAKWATSTSGYPASAETEARCVLVKKEG